MGIKLKVCNRNGLEKVVEPTRDSTQTEMSLVNHGFGQYCATNHLQTLDLMGKPAVCNTRSILCEIVPTHLNILCATK